MKTTKFLATLCCLLLIPMALLAQQPTVPRETLPASPYQRYTTYMVTFRYGVAQPLGGLGDYIDRLSTRNFTLAGEWVRPSNLSFGLQLNTNYFNKRLPRQTYQFGDGADVSAVQTRSINVQSLMATGKYHFSDVTASVRPYVQIGLGAALVDYGLYWGSLSAEENGSTVHFASQVAVGSRFLFGSEGHWGADVQAAYQYLPYSRAGINNISSLGASVGVFYRWW
jgi:opacity protein-like surface antigen